MSAPHTLTSWGDAGHRDRETDVIVAARLWCESATMLSESQLRRSVRVLAEYEATMKDGAA